MVGKKKANLYFQEEFTFFYTLFIFIYISVMVRFSSSPLLLNEPKKCIKSCMLLAWFFPKCWRYPITIKLKLYNAPKTKN
ncbi:hypothetical protein CN470_15855 [Bacillus cereus]|nr:hypothetical protein CN470_15855 [Bacillus cereus]